MSAKYSGVRSWSSAHLLQDRQLDLQELDRHPAHGQFGLGDDRRGQQAHRLDRVLGGRVVHVDVDGRYAVHGERRRADALDPYAQRLQEEAQVLDHVVGGRVADDGHAVVPGGGEQRVLGDGVAALGQHDRTAGGDGTVDPGVVEPLRRRDVQAEPAQRDHVRLDGPGAEVAAARVRQPEGVHAVQQRAEEHDDRAGPAGGLGVDGLHVQLGRRHDLQVDAVVDPAGAHADGAQHLQQAVHLFDAGDPAQHRAPLVEERGAQQRHTSVLAGLDVDGAGQPTTADHAQVHRTRVAERDDLAVEGFTDSSDHLKADVLVAALDAVDRALAGAERLGELRLCPAPVLSGVTDELADTYEVVVCHGVEVISDMR